MSLLGEYIDNGTFSKVYYKKGDKSRVIKVIQRYSFETDSEKLILNNELKLCKNWKYGTYNGLVNVFNVFGDGSNLLSREWFIEMEYGGKNLESLICNGTVRKMSDKDKTVVISKLIDIIDYLEKCGLRHLDIKSKNILLNLNLDNDDTEIVESVKLCDYDMLVTIADLNKMGCDIIGTMRYLPPLDSLDRSLKRCIWSLGCVFFELVYGFNFKNWDKKMDEHCAKSVFYNLIKGMLTIDQKKRYDLKDCKYQIHNLLATSKS